MKAQTARKICKRKIFVTLLFLFMVIACQAQWTFDETVSQSGNCLPYPKLPKITYYTKEACESNRQSELRNSGKDYSWLGDGNCNTIISCTPCVGPSSSASVTGDYLNPGDIAGQVKPGEISTNGLYEGKPFFTTHQSAAFEDWASEYKLLLASYGITSIVGAGIKSPVPLTGDINLDKLYLDAYMQFNPSVKPTQNKKEQKPDVIKPMDLKSGDPSLSLHASYVPPLMPITDGKIKVTNHPAIDAGQEFVTNAIGTLVPGWVGYGLKFGTNLIAEDVKAAVDIYNGDPCPTTETIISNAVITTVKGGIEDIKNIPENYVEGKALSFAKWTGIKSGIKPLIVFNAVKTFEWGKTAIETAQGGYKLGSEIGNNN